MRFGKFGKLNPDLTTEIKPIDLVDTTVFKRLDYLLEYLLNEDPEIHQSFVEKMKQKLQTLVKDEHFENKAVNLGELTRKYSHLKEQQELVRLHFNFSMQLLQISGEQLEEDTAIIPNRNYWRIFVPRYYQALVLSEIIGKEKTINLLKEFIDQYIFSVRFSIEKFNDLEALRSSHIKETHEGPGWVSVFSEVEDGEYIIRNENCLLVEALDDLEDKELVYVICCHGDFRYAEMQNEHFVLTRHYTIAEGDPYCDKVFHDTRIDKKITHPSKEFLDNIWPRA